MILAAISTGLAAGLASTAAMSLIEYPIWRKWGTEAVSEWHLNQDMMARLLHRPPQSLVLQGLFLHFLHGGLAGVVFALILPLLPFRVPIVVTGMAFGLILWVIALLMMKPVTGVGIREHSLKWLPLIETRCQPIALRDVLGYLVGCAEVEATAGGTFDIGGPDILTYRQMMIQVADVLGKKLRIYGLPILSPRLSSYWVDLMTDVPSSLARPLIDGLRSEVICRGDKIKSLVSMNLTPFREAVSLALKSDRMAEI